MSICADNFWTRTCKEFMDVPPDDWQLSLQFWTLCAADTFRLEARPNCESDVPFPCLFYDTPQNYTACRILLWSLVLHISVDAALYHPVAVGQNMVTTLCDSDSLWPLPHQMNSFSPSDSSGPHWLHTHPVVSSIKRGTHSFWHGEPWHWTCDRVMLTSP